MLPGTFDFVHLVIEIFSRYVFAWTDAEVEIAKLASLLVQEAIATHNMPKESLTAHSESVAPRQPSR